MRVEVIPWSRNETPSEATLRRLLADDGFEGSPWHDEPDARYRPHSHDHDESLWVIEGEITFGIGEREYCLGPGDRLMLPRGTVHTAHAGRNGASYLIGERSDQHP
jgi:quercetin dioxygenase-like cupin family protein